jgi:hypothetical protein
MVKGGIKMIYKKGQAAMEFLMTYGWAILAAVIAIGVLAYFGVFSPGSFISNSITVNPPFGTTQELSITTGSIGFVLRNGGGDSVTISRIAIFGCGADATGMTLADGTTRLVTLGCIPPLKSGDKFRGALTLTYRTGDELLDLTSTGTISGRVA